MIQLPKHVSRICILGSLRSSRLHPSPASTHVHRDYIRLIILIVYLRKFSKVGSQESGQGSHSRLNCTMPCILWNALQHVHNFQPHRTSLWISIHPRLYTSSSDNVSFRSLGGGRHTAA
ncbi:hypothetical protein CY34DRAFT_328245 [Suillus luteus UH-Slu-Lm8-n1]|uniref:Uncharacterized protein n=1 Tax=Suillus luteus UH-Slu-Lm8-n1 TaxID=930992 RepID=A0A0D0ACY6_9AGAM|nr:hypothetical protein CY34DRAFT_328245 [Suillus luteus UH-Slu-Lm8-n1]